MSFIYQSPCQFTFFPVCLSFLPFHRCSRECFWLPFFLFLFHVVTLWHAAPAADLLPLFASSLGLQFVFFLLLAAKFGCWSGLKTLMLTLNCVLSCIQWAVYHWKGMFRNPAFPLILCIYVAWSVQWLLNTRAFVFESAVWMFGLVRVAWCGFDLSCQSHLMKGVPAWSLGWTEALGGTPFPRGPSLWRLPLNN